MKRIEAHTLDVGDTGNQGEPLGAIADTRHRPPSERVTPGPENDEGAPASVAQYISPPPATHGGDPCHPAASTGKIRP
ncbi:hypothetical protein [Halomonas getboli]|uniref:hypothetical protein n=1 Tax=Halomonas getboli TaxID=2935862 RepID=UPI001FFEB47A|nr:hypothetical protein [Halomonas getboli]MCK2183672.1 hypothetical protein [Halomonas getboli]